MMIRTLHKSTNVNTYGNRKTFALFRCTPKRYVRNKCILTILVVFVMFLLTGCTDSDSDYSKAISEAMKEMEDSSYCFKKATQNRNRSYKSEWNDIGVKGFFEERETEYRDAIENYRFCLKEEDVEEACFEVYVDVPQLKVDRNSKINSTINHALIDIIFTLFCDNNTEDVFSEALNKIEGQNSNCKNIGRRFSIEVEYDLLYVADNYISMIISVFSAQGGAHPADFSEIVTYSVADNRVIDIGEIVEEDALFEIIRQGKYTLFAGRYYESLDDMDKYFSPDYIIEHYKHHVKQMGAYAVESMKKPFYDRASPYNFGMDENYYYIVIHNMRNDFDYEYIYLRVNNS